jgi:hypothetical protein
MLPLSELLKKGLVHPIPRLSRRMLSKLLLALQFNGHIEFVNNPNASAIYPAGDHRSDLPYGWRVFYLDSIKGLIGVLQTRHDGYNGDKFFMMNLFVLKYGDFDPINRVVPTELVSFVDLIKITKGMPEEDIGKAIKQAIDQTIARSCAIIDEMPSTFGASSRAVSSKIASFAAADSSDATFFDDVAASAVVASAFEPFHGLNILDHYSQDNDYELPELVAALLKQI